MRGWRGGSVLAATLVLLAACGSGSDAGNAATLALRPTITLGAAAIPPTPTLAAVTWPSATPSVTPSATPTATATPTMLPSATPTSTPRPSPPPAPRPTATPPPTLAATAVLSGGAEQLGVSVQGRPITATRLGTGPRAVAFVGDTHGGPEKETDWLIVQAIAYYRAHPAEIPSQVTAYFIPTLNPDGLADGTRFNADNVDLNRNFGTSDWNTTANEPDGSDKGAGGPRPFSEPESREMRDFLLAHHITASIFYHLPWGGIYSEAHSITFAQAVAKASTYPFHLPGKDTPYVMTGTAHRWADEHGELSMLLEMHGDSGTEWAQNHPGMNAAMQFVADASR